MSGLIQPQTFVGAEDSRTLRQRFPVGRALIGVLLVAVTGFAAGLIALSPI